MPISEAKKRANQKYSAKTYSQLNLRVRKEDENVIRQHADGRGESLNGFVNRAIKETMERDKSKSAAQE